jgi:polar amino acid transport system substrate-binding protein
MKQVVQNPQSGVSVVEVPSPALRGPGLLVRNHASLISAGTEKSVVSTSANLFVTARKRPDLVRRVLQMARQRGWKATLDMVRARLDSPTPLGYSCAGRVAVCAPGVTEFAAGDRVACGGASFANHAEMVYVPRNLCVRIPQNVSFDDAAYVTVGAIAMQGVRQADLRVGESAAVLGLGLIGQLAVQILKASGVKVLGSDLDAAKVSLAREMGADEAVLRNEGVEEAAGRLSGGRGVDAVIIAASTPSNDPLDLAAEICRDKGRVVALGAVGLNVPRPPFYHKELDLRLSRSYGPGRYDSEFEEKGRDYPYGYVRWTEQRNMESFLDLLAAGKIRLERLTTHRFPVEEAERAYAILRGEVREPYVGILLHYDAEKEVAPRVDFARPASRGGAAMRLGVIGAGSFAQGVLLPKLKEIKGAELKTVVTASGLTAEKVAKRFGFASAASSEEEIWRDSSVNAVLIATRHNLHAPLAAEALRRGKHVFVEKPLALSREEMSILAGEHAKSSSVLMVGFNRRFAPATQLLRDWFKNRRAPMAMHYRVNAGFIPKDHWVHDPSEGGGRVIGEVCHFVDWMVSLSGARVEELQAFCVRSGGPSAACDEDTLAVAMKFSDGSVGSLQYLANGPVGVDKEFVEVFCGGRYARIDDFRAVALGEGNSLKTRSFRAQDKGHARELRLFAQAVAEGGASPVPFEEALHVTETTFRIADVLRAAPPADAMDTDLS